MANEPTTTITGNLTTDPELRPIRRARGGSGMTDQIGLFTRQDAAPTVAGGVRAVPADPAASAAALTGDGYAWLAALLPAPHPLACEACGGVTVLPASAPALWTCPACHPAEVA